MAVRDLAPLLWEAGMKRGREQVEFEQRGLVEQAEKLDAALERGRWKARIEKEADLQGDFAAEADRKVNRRIRDRHLYAENLLRSLLLSGEATSE